MIGKVTSFINVNNPNSVTKSRSIGLEAKQDSIAFKGNKKFVSKDVLAMVKRFETETPVLGFKGDGKWVLPNLIRYKEGKRFSLYLPDGKQISMQRGQANDNVVFSIKSNKIGEKTYSKIKIPFIDEHNECVKLKKTKTDNVLSFRVNTKDAIPGHGDFKEGQIDKITKNADGSYSDTSNVSEKEHKQIMDTLMTYLPDFY